MPEEKEDQEIIPEEIDEEQEESEVEFPCEDNNCDGCPLRRFGM